MRAYLQGYGAALIKLGLSGSAIGAIGTPGSPASPVKTPGVPSSTSPIKSIKPPKPPKLFDAGKMQDAAWGHAQKDLDTGEARAIGKVDQWQQPSALPTGSST